MKKISVTTHGGNVSVLTEETISAWRRLYSFDALQVWKWDGGECLIAKDWHVNYGRGEYRAIVRTGGLKRGKVRVLNVNSFAEAMQALGLEFRYKTFRPRRERSSRELARMSLTRAAHKLGNRFRTIRAQPRTISVAA